MKQIHLQFPGQQQEAIVIKLWENYLLYHPADLYRTLSQKSIGHGPRHDEHHPGRITFRFAPETWETDIKHLLYKYRIPVNIQSNPLRAVRMKGRAPVLR